MKKKKIKEDGKKDKDENKRFFVEAIEDRGSLGKKGTSF